MRDALLERLVDDLDDRYTKDEIRSQWHNLMTTYKRERQRQEASKTSGTGKDDVYISNWEYFKSMFFLEATCNADESFNTLDEISLPPAKKKKKVITASTAELKQNAVMRS